MQIFYVDHLISGKTSYGHIHTWSENDPNINSYGKKNLGGTQFYFAFKSSVMSQGCWKMPLLTLESGGKWVVNAFSSFEQKRLILYRKYREIVNFSSFSTF